MEREWKLPDRGTVGIIFLIITETSLFTIFVAAYLIYIGKSLTGPFPKDVLERPILATICLLSSSLTIVFAEHALKKNHLGRFKLWWLGTILLGGYFLLATGVEWRKLIYEDHLTISTNLFGSTFYSLVGLHASHVIVGIDFSVIGSGGDAAGISDSNAVEAGLVSFLVLAFCGCCLGGGFYRGVHHRLRQVRDRAHGS